MEQWMNLNLETTIMSLSFWWRVLIFFGIFVIAYLVDMLFARLIIPTIHKIVKRTKAKWDDVLLSDRICRAFSNILPPVILLMALPIVIDGKLETILMRLCVAYIIVMIVRFLCVAVESIHNLFAIRGHIKARSLKGIVQTFKILFWIIGVILIISTLIHRSPLLLITGLGAMATVLMLVFQDSIKGLVAGIQLSTNDMVRAGDWIAMPARGVDGVVIDITLTTVKVRNWDNTIMTVQPYTLITETFQNWRGMSEGDGRRFTRSVNVDMHSVRFCTEEEFAGYREAGLLPKNAIPGVVTNLQVYRTFLYEHLKQNPDINANMTLMVRQLAACPEGLPVQIYCFTRTKVWEQHEVILANIVEFMIASMSQFGLYVYQRASGADSLLLKAQSADDEEPA